MAGKSLNKVQIIGNLGADPELRYTTNGTAVATLNIATNERFKRGDEWQERAEWHRVVLWDKLAELAGQYLSKGGKVYIEGRLQTRSWDDKDGIKRYTTEIVGRDMIFLSGRGDSSSQGSYPPHPADTYEVAAPTHTGGGSSNTQSAPSGGAQHDNSNSEPPPQDEEIPF